LDEGRDDIEFLIIARAQSMTAFAGINPPAGDGMMLGPPGAHRLLVDVREHGVQAVVGAGVLQVGEFSQRSTWRERGGHIGPVAVRA
jgi:hypothetical protein